jgi:hypothetical protein
LFDIFSKIFFLLPSEPKKNKKSGTFLQMKWKKENNNVSLHIIILLSTKKE